MLKNRASQEAGLPRVEPDSARLNPHPASMADKKAQLRGMTDAIRYDLLNRLRASPDFKATIGGTASSSRFLDAHDRGEYPGKTPSVNLMSMIPTLTRWRSWTPHTRTPPPPPPAARAANVAKRVASNFPPLRAFRSGRGEADSLGGRRSQGPAPAGAGNNGGRRRGRRGRRGVGGTSAGMAPCALSGGAHGTRGPRLQRRDVHTHRRWAQGAHIAGDNGEEPGTGPAQSASPRRRLRQRRRRPS